MEAAHSHGAPSTKSLKVNRRTAISRVVISGAAVALFAGNQRVVEAEEATPATAQCVATAPPTQDGVGLASLLVGGIVQDMPAGPVEVRITRFTLEPEAGVPAAAMPYPSLMYIETGESSCPGGPGKVMYGADGTVLDTSNGKDPHLCPTGTTWYIPAGIPDGADNLGTELMSSIVIEFVPVGADAAATNGTPMP
jgi:quercetin dioxygenase-like cupin family protein